MAKVVEDPTLPFFGFIQVLGSKRVVDKEKNITLVFDESQVEKMLSLPKTQ